MRGRHAGNELPAAPRKQDSGWGETSGRVGTKGLTEGRLETERQSGAVKEEHRGAGDKDGETLRIGTQGSLPRLDTPAKVSGRDIE